MTRGPLFEISFQKRLGAGGDYFRPQKSHSGAIGNRVLCWIKAATFPSEQPSISAETA